jgi:hypothetical protein
VKLRVKLAILLCSIVGVFFFSKIVFGQNVPVVITELVLNEDDNCQWVEIYNRTENKVNLNGWYFWESGKNTNIKEHSSYNSFEIKSNNFALLSDTPENILASSSTQKNECENVYDISSSTPILKVDFDGGLNEDGEKIGLKRSKSFSDLVEKFKYLSLESNNSSLERISPNDLDYTKDNWGFSSETSTPGRKNSNWKLNLNEATAQPPQANIKVSSTINQTAELSASSSIDDPNYQWNLKGNKKIQRTSTSVKYKYEQTGEKEINLITKNKGGAAGVSSKKVTIIKRPKAEINLSTSSIFAGEQIKISASRML